MPQQNRGAVQDHQIEVGARNLSTEPPGESADSSGPLVGARHQRVVHEDRKVEVAVTASASACPAPKEERKPDPRHRCQCILQSVLSGIEIGRLHAATHDDHRGMRCEFSSESVFPWHTESTRVPSKQW